MILVDIQVLAFYFVACSFAGGAAGFICKWMMDESEPRYQNKYLTRWEMDKKKIRY